MDIFYIQISVVLIYMFKTLYKAGVWAVERCRKMVQLKGHLKCFAVFTNTVSSVHPASSMTWDNCRRRRWNF